MENKKFFWKKQSFAKQIASIYIFIFLLQAIFIFAITGRYLTEVVKEKILDFSKQTLHQTVINIEAEITRFKRNVNEMIIDENFLESTVALDGKDIIGAKKYLKKEFRSFLAYRPEVRCMAIMTKEKGKFSYDRLEIDSIYQNSPHFYQNYFNSHTWKEGWNYENWISTTFYDRQGTKDYYLLTYNKQLYDWYADSVVGTFFVSMEESVFYKICEEAQISENKEENHIFITDEKGKVISHWNKKNIGKTTKEIYGCDLKNNYETIYEGRKVIIQTEQVSKEGWTVYSVLDYVYIMGKLRDFQKTIIIISILFGLCIIGLIYYVSKKMSKSVENIVATMEAIQEGEMYVKVEVKNTEKNEITIIATHFNEMMSTINTQMKVMKELGKREKEAEIKALEAQINPHFIYNTLDSINWLAIENEQKEISNMLSQFAQILRYQINGSNNIVTIEEELEHLEKYMYLQKVRFDDAYEYIIECETKIKKCYLHKMIFQPLIENAIIHGYANIQYCGILSIKVCEENNTHLKFIISDNGKGMTEEIIEEIFVQRKNIKKSIGIQNVLQRLDSYYGEDYRLEVKNKESGGIQITIIIPKDIYEEKKGADE